MPKRKFSLTHRGNAVVLNLAFIYFVLYIILHVNTVYKQKQNEAAQQFLTFVMIRNVQISVLESFLKDHET